MRCPFCKVNSDKVVDSRTSKDGLAIRRRRECLKCGRRFTSYERVEHTPLRVVKKDGRRVDFDRAKIKTGMERACWNLPVTAQQIDEAVDGVEAVIFDTYDREVHTPDIGELVMKELRELSQVAYVRFASVYREFTDVSEFRRVLEELVKQGKEKG